MLSHPLNETWTNLCRYRKEFIDGVSQDVAVVMLILVFQFKSC